MSFNPRGDIQVAKKHHMAEHSICIQLKAKQKKVGGKTVDFLAETKSSRKIFPPASQFTWKFAT